MAKWISALMLAAALMVPGAAIGGVICYDDLIPAQSGDSTKAVHSYQELTNRIGPLWGLFQLQLHTEQEIGFLVMFMPDNVCTKSKISQLMIDAEALDSIFIQSFLASASLLYKGEYEKAQEYIGKAEESLLGQLELVGGVVNKCSVDEQSL